MEKVLLLDVMGTLVHDPFFVEVPRFFGMTLDALVSSKHPTAWRAFELGEIDEVELGSRFFADGRAFDTEALKRTMRDAYRLLPGIESLLARLSAAGVPMHALSNYPPWYRLVEEAVGLSRFLTWTFVSCETGVRKPDPRAYLEAAHHLGVPPSACTFVDDVPANCEGAAATGMNAIHFTDAQGLEAALARSGFLVTGSS